MYVALYRGIVQLLYTRIKRSWHGLYVVTPRKGAASGMLAEKGPDRAKIRWSYVMRKQNILERAYQ